MYPPPAAALAEPEHGPRPLLRTFPEGKSAKVFRALWQGRVSAPDRGPPPEKRRKVRVLWDRSSRAELFIQAVSERSANRIVSKLVFCSRVCEAENRLPG